MRHGGNIPHRALSFEVGSAEARWEEASHPLFNFIFRTAHPDLDLRAPQRAVDLVQAMVPPKSAHIPSFRQVAMPFQPARFA